MACTAFTCCRLCVMLVHERVSASARESILKFHLFLHRLHIFRRFISHHFTRRMLLCERNLAGLSRAFSRVSFVFALHYFSHAFSHQNGFNIVVVVVVVAMPFPDFISVPFFSVYHQIFRCSEPRIVCSFFFFFLPSAFYLHGIRVHSAQFSVGRLCAFCTHHKTRTEMVKLYFSVEDKKKHGQKPALPMPLPSSPVANIISTFFHMRPNFAIEINAERRITKCGAAQDDDGTMYNIPHRTKCKHKHKFA